MAVCEKNQWTIVVETQPVPDPPRGGTLVFDVTGVDGINISGKVRELSGTMLGDFTGTCRAVPAQPLHVMSFDFVWGAVMVHLSGVVFVSDLPRFAGTFRAKSPTERERAAAEQAVAEGAEAEGAEAGEVSTLPPVQPPDSGDTGTGNGQQT